MKVCVVQPAYSLNFSESDTLFAWELAELDKCDETMDIIVLPEYSNVPCLAKTKEEMEVIKDKIRQTKLGAKNPMARRIRRTNIVTGEIDIFDTIISCAQACGIKNGKTSITTRLNGQIKSPYKNTWIFEYCDE